MSAVPVQPDSGARYSERHPHEPEIPPTLDAEGRCLICALTARLAEAESQRKLLERRIMQQRKELARWEEPHHGSSWYVRAEAAERQVAALEAAVREYEKRLGIPSFASLAAQGSGGHAERDAG